MADHLLEIKSFSHCYQKGQEAVHDLSLTVNKGDIYGLIGPNGAGKTTTFRFIATLLTPSRGQCFINGWNVVKDRQKIRRIIGFMPDHFGVYPKMTVIQFLDFFGLAYAIPQQERKTIISDVLELLDLTKHKDKPAEFLSRGMRQRLGLARTLLHNPMLLILDEPASGLDPRSRREIMGILKELQKMGKTIIVSSHILPELAEYCRCIGILENGRLVAQGTLSELVQKVQPHLQIRIKIASSLLADHLATAAPAPSNIAPAPSVIPSQNTADTTAILPPPELIEKTVKVLKSNSKVTDILPPSDEEPAFIIDWVGVSTDIPILLQQLIEARIPVFEFSPFTLDLEQIFFQLTKS